MSVSKVIINQNLDPELEFARVLAQQFGKEVASEADLISRILPEVAAEQGLDMNEGDLEGFCRFRLAKIEHHKAKEAGEEFEQVRLLNMLYEKALEHLNKLLDENLTAENSAEILNKLIAIVEHLDQTLSFDGEQRIADDLHDIYDFILQRLEDDSESLSVRVNDVIDPLEQIYLGYLEIELRADIEDYFDTCTTVILTAA